MEKGKKTYNTRDSLVVTDPTTNLAYRLIYRRADRIPLRVFPEDGYGRTWWIVALRNIIKDRRDGVNHQ